MRGAGLSYEAEMERLARPDILGLGAAIENLLLCAQDLGYGGCWMNAPALAAPEIDEYLGKAGEGLRLMSLVPIGRPAYTPREKPCGRTRSNSAQTRRRKHMADMLTILETKKRGGKLAPEEIACFVHGVYDGSVPGLPGGRLPDGGAPDGHGRGGNGRPDAGDGAHGRAGGPLRHPRGQGGPSTPPAASGT